MSQTMGFSISTVLDNLKKIGKVRKLDKLVPHGLIESLKAENFEVCSMLFRRKSNDPFLDRIVTCDEKLVFYDNPKQSAQWLNHNEAPKDFPKLKYFKQKFIITLWSSAISIVHHSSVESNQSITAEVSCQQLGEMHIQLS